MLTKYENILVAGDLTIDLCGSKYENDNHFAESKEKLNLTNLIEFPIYFMAQGGTFYLQNRPNCFQKTTDGETGLSDCHKWF